MKAMFGLVSLLVALAIVGLLAVKQLRSAAPSVAAGGSSTATAVAGVPPIAAGGTVREQSQQIQQKVLDDVNKALQQGADANKRAADQ